MAKKKRGLSIEVKNLLFWLTMIAIGIMAVLLIIAIISKVS